MVLTILKRAASVLLKKPIKLWAISLLNSLLTVLAYLLCGTVVALSLGIVLLLSTSMTMLYLHGYRGEEVSVEMLFECFKDWKTAKHVLAGMAWANLWVFIWGLIPLAGPVLAIIKSYSYSFTPYILITKPEISATEALKLSIKQTDGYKGKMFGAEILVEIAFIVVAIVLALFGAIPYIGVLFGIILFVFSVACAALLPLYMGLIHAAFYDEITRPETTAQYDFEEQNQ